MPSDNGYYGVRAQQYARNKRSSSRKNAGLSEREEEWRDQAKRNREAEPKKDKSEP